MCSRRWKSNFAFVAVSEGSGEGQGKGLTRSSATILTSLDAIPACSRGIPSGNRRYAGVYDFPFSTSPRMPRR